MIIFRPSRQLFLPSGAVQFTLNNVGQLRTKGVELELSARPMPALRLEASAAYTDATIVSFPRANCYTGQTAALGCVGGFQNLAGFPLANSPKFKFTIGASYDVALPSLPFDGFISADYRHQSRINYDLSQNPATVQPAYGLFNASLGFKSRDSDRYRVTFFVSNLFDKAYTGSLGLGTGASTDLIVQYLPRDYQRTFGLRLNTQF